MKLPFLFPAWLLLAGVLLLLPVPARASWALGVPSFFSENMVVQRDMPLPIWGWAEDGEAITVHCADEIVSTVAANGHWRVTLPPLKAGGPYTIVISGKDPNATIMLTQVLAGEVWIVCGQSNAGMTIENADGGKEAIATRFEYPNIRTVSLGRRDGHLTSTPQEQAYSWWGACKWENSTYLLPRFSSGDKPYSQTVPGGMSALGYFFARETAKYFGKQMPVGIVQLGAILPVQTWVDDATVAQTPLLLPVRGKGWPDATSNSYNDQVAPLAPFPVRGVVYYQGEMNANKDKSPFYRAGLTALISSWRHAWNRPDLPFLVVQLSGFIKHLGPADKRLDMDAKTLAQFTGENADHGFCDIREAQLEVARAVPHTGLAVTFDLGDPWDVHPRKKLPVAQRLFLQARKLVYGETGLNADSPYPQTVQFKNGAAEIQFGGIGSGLASKGKTLKGFELSADGITFSPAIATLTSTLVRVASPAVPAPVAVRYAWAGWPDANLYNREGLPATPFRFPVPVSER